VSNAGEPRGQLAAKFLALHHGDAPFVIPNAWDAGSAKLFESLGAAAIATTSSGYAATLGRLDYDMTRAEAVAHCRVITGAVTIPVSADFENGFADDPADVAEAVREAKDTGLCGLSIEDFTREPDRPLYEPAQAAARVEAAADAAHGGDVSLVLTARAEGALRGRGVLDGASGIIARLQSFQENGADVLFAPGVTDLDEIATIVRNVDRPLNVILPAGVTVAQLGEAGVRRVSVGGSLAFAALAAAADAVRQLLQDGSGDYLTAAAEGRRAARDAFSG
jgi:2-methylisocitrate lyase-like PEP mutase family enzyme